MKLRKKKEKQKPQRRDLGPGEFQVTAAVAGNAVILTVNTGALKSQLILDAANADAIGDTLKQCSKEAKEGESRIVVPDRIDPRFLKKTS